MRTTWNFYSAGRLIFGCKAVRQLAQCLEPLQVGRVLVVTDPSLVAAGIVERVLEPLRAAGIESEVFDGGQPEPPIEVALQSAEAARAFQPGAIVGVGGGSNMDLAKITAVLATHGGELSQYFGWNNVPGRVLPIVCVPTTSGTGSEVSHAAVLTDTANAMKVSMLSNFLRPAVAVVDPELTLTCPAKATADSGIDALTHAIEACTAVDYSQLQVPPEESAPYDGRHPLGDVLAEKAIRLIAEHLVPAVRQPDNLAAREGMSLAATLAGMAFSNCAVAVVHALEYPLGGALHVSHGAGNGLLLPYVMRFNMPARQATFARIAQWLGEDTAGLDDAAAAERAIVTVERLREQVGIPQRIRELGGTPEQLPGFAAKAAAIKRLMLLNPRMPTEADLLGIYQAAW